MGWNTEGEGEGSLTEGGGVRQRKGGFVGERGVLRAAGAGGGGVARGRGVHGKL